VADAADQLGGIPLIRETFIGFQQYLYASIDNQTTSKAE
jgi:hypothetical protein